MMVKQPYSQQREARRQNISLLLSELWRYGPLSKANLAQRTGLTKATVSAICSDLESAGLIREVGQNRSGLGRPGNLLELNPLARVAIGVEISTNYSAAVLTDLCGQAVWKSSALIPVGSGQDAVLTRAAALVAEAVDQAREREIPVLGIGVAVPGIVEPGPESPVSASALGWKGVPLKSIWEERFALPVVVENKARTAAMAEALNGSAQRVSSFVYVSLGTDTRSSIQAAAITNGCPYRGARGLAVDAGHMILDPDGPLCSCGQRGCWEAMTDVEREVELARARLEAGATSVLQAYASEKSGVPAESAGASIGASREAGGLDHRAIHQAALEGDALAKDILRAVHINHAFGITNLVRLFDPELVVIGWASMALSDVFHTRMRALSAELDVPGAVRQLLARRGVPAPAIVDATHGPEAPMLGAAAMLVDELLLTPAV